MFHITEKDILLMYKEKGNIKEYVNSLKYLKIMKLKESTIKKIAKRMGISESTAKHWIKNERVPYGIKCLQFLKKKNLVPYVPNERMARIVGFLHGDGYVNQNLGKFGFISKDKNILSRIKKDVKEELKIKAKLIKKRDIGGIESINGKKYFVKHPTYELKVNNRNLCLLLFRLGAPKGKKIYQETFVPEWVMRGNKKIKKAFLQGLFDSELCNARVSTYKHHKNNLSSPRMEMAKASELEANLRQYLEQISALLKNFEINTSMSCVRNYNQGKISLTLNIKNKLINIYSFIDKVGFYYNFRRMKQAEYVQQLALEKIKGKNALYMILEYCKNNSHFTIKDLKNNLKLPSSSSRLWGAYLYKNGFATRKRMKNRWFKYSPNVGKIKKIIDNPLLLGDLPNINHEK